MRLPKYVFSIGVPTAVSVARYLKALSQHSADNFRARLLSAANRCVGEGQHLLSVLTKKVCISICVDVMCRITEHSLQLKRPRHQSNEKHAVERMKEVTEARTKTKKNEAPVPTKKHDSPHCMAPNLVYSPNPLLYPNRAM
jgi:hypothetical protein